jgi:glucosyl-3-phosphoglycerate phosphatase
MRLLLVRHGQSEWNAGRILQGQADIALSALGREQADALAPAIAGLKPCRAMTSDLIRASETAARLGFPDARPEPRLREIDVGGWQGRAIADLLAEDAAAYQGWRAGTFRPEGGELWDEFAHRTAAAVLDEAAKGGKTLLAVCHGGVIRALLHRLVGLPPRQIIPAAPASLTVLRLNGDGQGTRLELFNWRPTTLDLEAPD